jgi:hypothetical protein
MYLLASYLLSGFPPLPAYHVVIPYLPQKEKENPTLIPSYPPQSRSGIIISISVVKKETRGLPSGRGPSKKTTQTNSHQAQVKSSRPHVACTQASGYDRHGYNPVATLTSSPYIFYPQRELSPPT